jgi:predicted amidohydrolase
MAVSTCPACRKTEFEIQSVSLPYYDLPLSFVQCSACGAVIGVTTVLDAGVLGRDNQKEIAALKQQLTRVEARLVSIQEQLDPQKK